MDFAAPRDTRSSRLYRETHTPNPGNGKFGRPDRVAAQKSRMASIGRVNVKVSLLKRAVKQSKDEVKGEIGKFTKFLGEARRQFARLTEVIQANARREFYDLTIEVDAQKRLLRERELKIARQKQKIVMLREQVEAGRERQPSSALVMQLQAELAEKQQRIEELVQATQERTVGARTEDASLGRLVKDLKFKIVQLETKLDEKERVIEQMKMERVTAIRVSEQLQKSQRDAEALKESKAYGERLENELAEKDKEIEQLKAIVMQDSEQSEMLSALEEGHEKLVEELERRSRMVEDGKKTMKEQLARIKELERTIRDQGNELAVVRAEANKAKKDIEETAAVPEPVVNESEKVRKEMGRMKRRTLELETEIEQLKSDQERNDGIIEALRANVASAEKKTAKVAEEKKVLEIQIDRKTRTIDELKAKVKSQEEGFRQKELLLEAS